MQHLKATTGPNYPHLCTLCEIFIDESNHSTLKKDELGSLINTRRVDAMQGTRPTKYASPSDESCTEEGEAGKPGTLQGRTQHEIQA